MDDAGAALADTPVTGQRKARLDGDDESVAVPISTSEEGATIVHRDMVGAYLRKCDDNPVFAEFVHGITDIGRYGPCVFGGAVERHGVFHRLAHAGRLLP